MPSVKHLLPPVDRYFKTNLHTHSTISDGRQTPEELKAAYKAKGYSILCISDHDVVVDHSDMNEPDFLLLTGSEYGITEKGKPVRFGQAKAYHLNSIAKQPDNLWQPYVRANVRDDVRPYLEKTTVEPMSTEYSIEAINAMIARANETGHLVTYNHPSWSRQSYPDYAGLKGLWGMELTNYGCVNMGVDEDNWMVYRDLMNLDGPIFPVCADDLHAGRDLAGGWIMVGAEKLEYASVIQALERGDFYASTGPEIHSLTFDGSFLEVRCSDAREVLLTCGIRYGVREKPIHNDGLLRTARFDLRPWLDNWQDIPEYWFQVRVRGPYGHCATTRAYRKEDLMDVLQQKEKQ